MKTEIFYCKICKKETLHEYDTPHERDSYTDWFKCIECGYYSCCGEHPELFAPD